MNLNLRLLAAAFCAMALSAQNPLAMMADPFNGTFQNADIKLELTRSGQEYTGAIVIAGQSLPVKAKAVAGKLTGTFASQGQTYAFQATRSGTQVTLITDGTTHVLDKAAPPAPQPPQTAAAPPAIVGIWQSPTGVVRINADGSAVIGDKTHRWTLEGNTINFSGDGNTIKVPFELNGDSWTWKFPDGSLPLTRTTTAALAATDDGISGSWQGPTGNIQLNLDGTATVGGVVYRYSRSGNQVTLNGPDGTFVATVQRNGDTMTWIVNGKTLTFQRSASTWAVGGGKGANGTQPELVGKWCQMANLNNSTSNYSRSACFTLLADGTYLYASDFGATGNVAGGAYGTAAQDNDSGTWTATADTITSTSKKTGVRTFRLEKRNHPKTGDAMLVLDGTEFTTAYQRPAWR